MSILFQKRKSIEQIEESCELAPKFDESGLIPAITSCAETGDILMLGYMNQSALSQTIETGFAHYYSRSRDKIWRKGEESDMTQKVLEILIDDDQDALWLKVLLSENPQGTKASCHVGYRSCFYRKIEREGEHIHLTFTETAKSFDPQKIYRDSPNPTKI